METYERLEQEWAEFNGLGPDGMVVCTSGTAALHLALEAMRLPPGSEVVVPDLTMIAVPRAVVAAGLTPVLVDCDETLNIDLRLTPVAAGERTAGIALVHTYGRPVNMVEVTRRVQATSRRPIVVEDLAEAHGVRPNPVTDAACWSFYRNKVVAGEEGGAVWFRDLWHAELARSLRSLGFTPAHDFRHVPRGWNHRMSNVHAHLILDSLRGHPGELTRRRELEAYADSVCPEKWRMPTREVPWVYDFRVKWMGGGKQDELVMAIRGAGVQARHCFKPIHEQEEFRGCRVVKAEAGLSGASRLSREVVYIPLGPDMTKDKIKLAFDAAARVL